MQLVSGLVTYLLILVAIANLRPDDALARSIVAILGSMMLLKASDIAVFWFESQVQSKYNVWVQNAAFLVVTTRPGCWLFTGDGQPGEGKRLTA